MKKYVIKSYANADYYLTNRYEPAAEIVLGYGGVWGKDDIKIFTNRAKAMTELKIIKAKTHLRAVIVDISDSEEDFINERKAR